MLHQYSFSNNVPSIYLIPTPIGNLSEMNKRAIDILTLKVSKIFCEDTRVTKKLLNYFNIEQELISLHKFNEEQKYNEVIKILNAGQSIAIVSDAGYPLISDPGFYVVKKILQETPYYVIPLSGPNAALDALIASGFDPSHFCFYGFLPRRKKEITEQLLKLSYCNFPIVFYESPHRVISTLKEIGNTFGFNSYCCVAKELTKINEQFFRGSINEILINLETNSKTQYGEYVIIAKKEEIKKNINNLDDYFSFCQEVDELIRKKNLSTKKAIEEVAQNQKISKNLLYQKYHKKTIKK